MQFDLIFHRCQFAEWQEKNGLAGNYMENFYRYFVYMQEYKSDIDPNYKIPFDYKLHIVDNFKDINVTNNTLGVNSDDTISLNSGGIDKMTGDRIILEDVIASYSDNDTEAGIVLENEFGHLLEEAGGGMPADLTLGLDSDASFTVS